jgi:hypothetical protein
MADDSFVNPEDRIEEMLLGKEGVAKKRRAAEIEHERELARIRSESHALVWTGNPKELTETIRRWFEAGWIKAANLQDAMEKAAIHFHRPDGTLVIKPIVGHPQRVAASTQSDVPNKRLSATIYSPIAARKMEAFLEENGIGQTEFAIKIGTTDRTLRKFRTTGKIKRSIFDEIAKGMGISRDTLLNN